MPKEPTNSPGLRLIVEDEFAASTLVGKFFPQGAPSVHPTIAPADYPNYDRHDLIIARHRGDFVKPCPGTLNYNCCGLNIFHFGLGCTLDCRYCILSAYLGTSALVLFGNVEEGLGELTALLDQPPDQRPKRFCTGEFTDSLLLDHRSGLATKLIELFAATPGAMLELKTKTNRVDHLLDLDHQGHTIISFSVNAPDISQNEEGQAAPLTARLAAAQRAAAAGYRLGFHFDPLIFHPGWAEGYTRTIDLMAQYLEGAEVAWVSLGCFRYLPSLKEVMLNKHPDTPIYNAEFITGGDGKMRYPRPLRTQIYRLVTEALRRILPASTVIYLCMESGRVWRDVFGFDPHTEGLTSLLDQRALDLSTQFHQSSTTAS